MPLYTNTGSLDVTVSDTTGTGIYSANGSLRVTLVSGVSYSGLYAADGSINVTLDTTGSGVYHSSGAVRGSDITGSGIYSSSGGYRMTGLNTPTTLFSTSEPGVWYDPSDLSTLFQDSAGTTPVTAPAQPVGLMLDKSKGLVLGAQLVTNGDFSVNVNGWTVVSSTFVWSDGKAILTATVGEGYVSQSISGLTAGTSYAFSFSATGGNSRVVVGTTIGSDTAYNGPYGLTGNISGVFVAPASSVFFSVKSVAGVGVPVTIDNISVRALPGNHATQSTSGSRPTYQVDAFGKPYLSFDGIDDFMITPTITPGTDKVQVFAGVRKLSDAAAGTVVEMNGAGGVLNGLMLRAPGGASNDYVLFSGGSTAVSVTASGFVAPVTNVATGIGDIAAPSVTLRINGVQAATSASTQGTGNYGNYPLYIGRRAGTSLPFNGQIYGLIVRFGANLDSATITRNEKWMGIKTGVTV
jgi:hypothetical protein